MATNSESVYQISRQTNVLSSMRRPRNTFIYCAFQQQCSNCTYCKTFHDKTYLVPSFSAQDFGKKIVLMYFPHHRLRLRLSATPQWRLYACTAVGQSPIFISKCFLKRMDASGVNQRLGDGLTTKVRFAQHNLNIRTPFVLTAHHERIDASTFIIACARESKMCTFRRFISFIHFDIFAEMATDYSSTRRCTIW